MTMDEIVKILRERGPLLGRELQAATGMNAFDLWRACKRSREVIIKRIGKRYLRFDRRAKRHARLSPSVQREFATYSLVALRGDEVRLLARAEWLRNKIKSVSARKLSLAKKVAADAVNAFPEKQEIKRSACFVIGGDVALEMAHDEPRPEKSTGEMVAGSDLDIIVIADDNISDNFIKKLDSLLYEAKHLLLRQPQKEELDYIIKRLSKVRKQARFDSFENKIACKIINESKFLYGSARIYSAVGEIMRKSRVPEKLIKLRKEATKNRAAAERRLLTKEKPAENELRELFSTTEEFSELF